MSASDRFAFRVNDQIGAADAESDEEMLKTCFVDSGLLEFIQNPKDPKRLILGRTGIGKTALLNHLHSLGKRVIAIAPETLAIEYISNSSVIRQLIKSDVKLDSFFRLIWRHVLAVEILKENFGNKPLIEEIKAWMRGIQSSNKKECERAFEYMQKWGDSFWQTTDVRMRELTTNLEKKIDDSLNVGSNAAGLKLSDSELHSASEKTIIAQRAQDVINQIQLRELSDIIELIDSVLDHPATYTYVIIDRLDENWVDDDLRCRLIRSLIETIKDFKKVRHVKIFACIRIDLINRVFRATQDTGLQTEKYQSLNLEIKWTKGRLTELLNSRINKLVRQRYSSKAVVQYQDILPATIDAQDSLDYILDRTLMRPRDVIQFFNACISEAVESPRITSEMLKAAEGNYSRTRLDAIEQEWSTDYPHAKHFVPLLSKKPSRFHARDLDLEELANSCYELFVRGDLDGRSDEFSRAIYNAQEGPNDLERARQAVIFMFFQIGIINLKIDPNETWISSYDSQRTIDSRIIGHDAGIAVHRAFWRALKIRPIG